MSGLRRFSVPGVTELLQRWGAGDDDALHQILEEVYGDLHRLATAYFSGERKSHTLQPTALVHEACLRLMQKAHPRWRDRNHFFAVAALQMRHILVEHARAKAAAKRGGGELHVSLEDSEPTSRPPDPAILDLDAALARLEAAHPRKARIAELRYFGGLEVAEVAEALGISKSSVEKDWAFALAWLRRDLAAPRT